MPPIHMPAWPVSTTTMASSGTCCDSSWHMPLGPDRHRVGLEQRLVLCRTTRRRSPAPRSTHGLRCAALRAIGLRQHARQRHLGVAVDARPAADSCGRAPPASMSIWIAGVPIFGTAQKWVVMPPVSVPMKQTRSARVDDAVGALARIGADHADRQRMVAGDRVLAVERGRDRNLQRLGERDQFAPPRRKRARRRRRRSPAARRPAGS